MERWAMLTVYVEPLAKIIVRSTEKISLAWLQASYPNLRLHEDEHSGDGYFAWTIDKAQRNDVLVGWNLMRRLLADGWEPVGFAPFDVARSNETTLYLFKRRLPS